MRAIVLTYHSHNIAGGEYHANDHVALASDLRTITDSGGRIVSLESIVDAMSGGPGRDADRTMVGLSFDDGPIFDYADFVHPRFGSQRSFLNIMRDFRQSAGGGAQPELHATSFVIASPEARAQMERAEDCGFAFLDDWLSDSWWKPAAESGLMDIGNHSWDHVHHAVGSIAITAGQRDNFELVDNYVDADREIRRATTLIKSRAGGKCSLFAFPFGHSNRYLVQEYLPARRTEHEMRAAFGVASRAIAPDDSIWNIPRLVCGFHWKTPEELALRLRAA